MNRVPPSRAPVRARLPRPAVGGVVAMAIAVGLIVWLVTRSGGSSAAPSTPTTTPTTTAQTATPYGPTALDVAGLKSAVASFGQSVFWVGRDPGHTYELKRLSNGEVFLRYLPAGVKSGDPRLFPTIGTYPFPTAYASELALAKKSGWTRLRGTTWLAVYRDAKPTSVYLAAKGFPYQIEVFHPSAAIARALVMASRVTPVP